MGFWDFITGGVNHAGEIPNANPPASVGAGTADGDPHGVEIVGDRVESRSLPSFFPSPWAGWPSNWSTPDWDTSSRFNRLVDVAWNCLDKNASVLSSMPVMRVRAGHVMEPTSWMINPDPTIYSSWNEFAKQLFWDFQLGEVFIRIIETFADGFPSRFRVIPPWVMHVEMINAVRRYRLGGSTGPDVTDEILHIRYKSTTGDGHGVGPLEAAGGRVLTAGLLAKYMAEVVATGGSSNQTIDVDVSLTDDEAKDLQTQYLASKVSAPTAPPVFDNGAKLVDHPPISPKDLTMLEISQFNESRIAVLLGVPPFLVGLPSGSDSMTYSNVTMLFDFHDRQMLVPLDVHVMRALSFWGLPRGQAVELRHDEYSRPSFEVRADAWDKLIKSQVVTPEEVRVYERFQGEMTDMTSEDTTMNVITGGE